MRMSKAILGVLMVWISLMVVAPLLTSAISTLVFDVGNPTISKYATFLTSLRDTAKDATLKCYGIPMLPNSTQDPKYLLVELRAKLSSGQAKSITLMLKRHNLYVLGYSDPYDTNKCRFHIFKDVTDGERQSTMSNLCPNPNARVQKDINYGSDYNSLIAKARVGDRSKVLLGVSILNSDIGKISGVENFTEKTEAEFLLVAIQMVPEAARLKYIENQVKTNFNRNFNPNPKVIDLENSWGKISTAIHGAKNGALTKPLELQDPSGGKWIVLRVDEIKLDIALLKHVNGSCQVNNNPYMFLFPPLIMSYYDGEEAPIYGELEYVGF